jgi:hypothetical protein
MSDWQFWEKQYKIVLASIPYVVSDIHPVVDRLLANGGTIFGGILREVVKSACMNWNPELTTVDYLSQYLAPDTSGARGDIDVYMPFVEGDDYQPVKTFDLLASIFGIDNLHGAENAYDFDTWKSGYRIGVRSESVFRFVAVVDGVKFDISVTEHPERLLGLVTRYSMENMKLTAAGVSMCFGSSSERTLLAVIENIRKQELVIVKPESDGIYNPGKFIRRTLAYLEQGWTLHVRQANQLAPHMNEILTNPTRADVDLRDPNMYQFMKMCLYPSNEYGLLGMLEHHPRDIITLRTMPRLRSIAEFHQDGEWIDKLMGPGYRPWTLEPKEVQTPEMWPDFETLNEAIHAANRVKDITLIPKVLKDLHNLRAKERPTCQNLQVWYFNNLIVRSSDQELIEIYLEYILDGVTNPVDQRLVIMHLVVPDFGHSKYTPLHRFLMMFHRRYSFILEYIWNRFGFMSVPLIAGKCINTSYDGQIPQAMKDKWYKQYWCIRLVHDFGFPADNIETVYTILMNIVPDALPQEYKYPCRHIHFCNNFYPQFRTLN